MISNSIIEVNFINDNDLNPHCRYTANLAPICVTPTNLPCSHGVNTHGSKYDNQQRQTQSLINQIIIKNNELIIKPIQPRVKNN